tara:strand:- start:40 stop:333 length:294 start_codon:yes stop_codon:yes gene_type:complete
MQCPKCKSKNTRVGTTEGHGAFTKRYCKCLDCGLKFRTIEKYFNAIEKPGPKESLNEHQRELIQKNKYMLSRKEWATIYKVSLSTIIKAENKLTSIS